MDSCCQNKGEELAQLRKDQSKVLWIVLAINATMFLIEVSAGIYSGSVSLQADSLDALGDALVYGFSLYVIAKSMRWRAVSAVLKGTIMAVFGTAVLIQSVYKIFYGITPEAGIIGLFGVIALAANSFCLYLLTRHRRDDINMRSTWLCSRNDIIANSGVILAAILVWVSGSMWPDLFVAFAITFIFLRSSLSVLSDALTELRNADTKINTHTV